MKHLLRWLSILPVLLMLLLIFGFSAQDGAASGSLSYKVSYLIVCLFNRVFSLDSSEIQLLAKTDEIHLLIRKLAHVTEYFLLTLSFYLPLRIWLPYKKVSVEGKQFLYKLILPAFLSSLICAGLDELHQHFVPGRCGTPLDVLVDSIGIIVACILLILCTLRLKKRRRPHKLYAK